MTSNKDKTTTLFIGNLPFDFTNQQLEDEFGEIGPIKRSFIVTNKDTKQSKGVGYVTFSLRDDAETAIQKCKLIGGRRINISFADKRKVTKREKKDLPTTDLKPEDSPITADQNAEKQVNVPEARETPAPPVADKRTHSKRGRLIIRNLAFTATEKDLIESFSKFGKVVEALIPTKSDGKRKKGFGIVQFAKVTSANRAIDEMNAKEFMSRPIAVDWAMPKDAYLEAVKQDSGVDVADDEEELEEDEGEAEEESTIQLANVKDGGSESEMDEDESGDDGEDDEGDEVNSLDDDDESGEECEEEEEEEKPERPSDVNEMKTLFIRNIPFEVDKGELKDAFSKFGSVVYALICVDKDSDHPKGTGFVKFHETDGAEKCYRAADDDEVGIHLKGQKLSVDYALSRGDLTKRLEDKKTKKGKDKRNLYLAREGLIRAGSRAAQGVSQHDLDMRQKLEVWKRGMLANLNTFVSRKRLCIRNIPDMMGDATLRKIMEKHSSPNAKLTECRIIRDLRQTDQKGNAASKRFGFVAFEMHEDAISALRNINNNPEVFTVDKRPIVEFSLENKAALLAKDRRLQKSIERNKELNEERKHGKRPIRNKKEFSKKRLKSSADPASQQEGERPSDPEFRGAKAIAKEKGKRFMMLPSHVGPKQRHKPRPKITRKQFGKEKRRQAAKIRRKEAERAGAPSVSFVKPKRAKSFTKGKKNKKPSKFDKMIAQRKQQVRGREAKGKSKWFES